MVLLQQNSSSWFIITSNKLHLLLLIPSSPHHFPYKPNFKNLSIKCQETSNSSQTTESISTTVTPPNKTSSSSAAGNGIGFGSSSNSTNAAKTPQVVSKKKLKGKKNRELGGSIIRRAPLAAKPNFVSQKEEEDVLQVIKESSQNERAFPFLVGWIVFGAVVILEGIVLASSGFLPEEWDKFLVKYLYPTFTPTVFLFVLGTAAYGVLKYMKNGKPQD